MIEKFNFYDIYGNLFPGIALISFVWIPVGVASGQWPGKELSSAVASLVLAYFVGHLIQILAGSVVPADVEVAKRTRRYPSDFILDDEDHMLSTEFKKNLAEAITARKILPNHDLHIAKPSKEITSTISAHRNEAFRQARATLLRTDSKSYAQQFEGLYAMMRGLAVAFWFGCFYFAGWPVSHFLAANAAANALKIADLRWVAGGLVAVALVVGVWLTVRSNALEVNRGDNYKENKKEKVRLERRIGALLSLVSLLSGVLVGWTRTLTLTAAIACALFGVAALLCAFRCYGAYAYFAKEFARAVWSDFLNLQLAEKPPEPPTARRQAAGKK